MARTVVSVGHRSNPSLTTVARPHTRGQERQSASRSILMAVTLGCVDLMLRGILALTRNVSEQRLLSLAPVIGQMMRRPWKKQTLGNMKLFLGKPEWSETQWDQLWKAHTRHVGQTIVEFFVWARLTAEEVLERISIRGENHLRETLQAGRGAMVLANHTGNFLALAPCLYKMGMLAHVSGNRMPTPFLDALLHDFARRFGIRYLTVGRGLLPLAAAESFKRGNAFFAFVDLSVAGKREAWFRFGRAETNVSIGPVLLARRHRVPVLCVSCRRLDATHHEVTFHPPLPMPASTDGRADAHHLTAQALEIVAGHIENDADQWWQWFWVPLRPLPAGRHPGAREIRLPNLGERR